jgi:hypothetical protein
MIGDDPYFDVHASTRAGIRRSILIDATTTGRRPGPRPPARTSGCR